jgi:hypothetical protein
VPTAATPPPSVAISRRWRRAGEFLVGAPSRAGIATNLLPGDPR